MPAVERDRRIDHPGLLVVGCFGALIALGTALLWLPASHTESAQGVDISVGDAFFTAASAVTVTGLVVVDTGTAWSSFGEMVLLGLIQIGGLGIMTMAGFVGIALNRRLGVRSGLLAGEELGVSDLGVLRHFIRNLVVFVVAAELVVAVLLTGRFLVDDDPGVWQAIHLGVFHAVSAFNNAGFSIFDGGLERYVGDWYVNVVIAGAFIVGGLGFPVVFELRRRWRQPSTWSLHTKVTLAVSALLLLGGAVLIAIVEWSNAETLGELSTGDSLVAAMFQSATARTAGFNTLPIGSMRTASWLVLVLLMVIGASSASTGGGIKTSTFAVVVKSTFAEFRRDSTPTMFEREISPEQQRRALALVVAALGTVGTATFLLTALQPDLPFGELLFEAASAFGTAGISTGVTTALDGLARVVIVVLMFLGRVGPLTFGTALLLRQEPKRYGFAQEQLIVG